MTEFSTNLTFDKQETVVLARRASGTATSASDELEHALRANSIDIVVEARHSSPGGTLVLSAEESDDGVSWSLLEEIDTLFRAGTASLTVTPAKEWLRVFWDASSGWSIDATATGHATIEAINTMPDEWTIGNATESGSLDIQTDTTDAHFRLRTSSDHNATIDLGVSDSGEGDVSSVINVESTGAGVAQLSLFNPSVNGGFSADGRGQLQLFTEAARQAIQCWDAEGNVVRFAIAAAGQPIIAVTAAPADADLASSQVALWFDATDGAAKLKIKGKSADGTVVTGSVNLS